MPPEYCTSIWLHSMGYGICPSNTACFERVTTQDFATDLIWNRHHWIPVSHEPIHVDVLSFIPGVNIQLCCVGYEPHRFDDSEKLHAPLVVSFRAAWCGSVCLELGHTFMKPYSLTFLMMSYEYVKQLTNHNALCDSGKLHAPLVTSFGSTKPSIAAGA